MEADCPPALKWFGRQKKESTLHDALGFRTRTPVAIANPRLSQSLIECRRSYDPWRGGVLDEDRLMVGCAGPTLAAACGGPCSNLQLIGRNSPRGKLDLTARTAFAGIRNMQAGKQTFRLETPLFSFTRSHLLSISRFSLNQQKLNSSSPLRMSLGSRLQTFPKLQMQHNNWMPLFRLPRSPLPFPTPPRNLLPFHDIPPS